VISGRIAAGIAALLALALAAPAAGAGDAVVSRPAAQGAAKVRAYWTPARMRAASPADLVLNAAGELARAVGEPRAATDVSASSQSFPERAHGKVFFSIAGGTQPGDYVCSGTAVRSNRHTLAWTAGHCVNDPEFGGGFATNWIFVPGYHNGDEPFGEWPATELLTTAAWRDDANIRQDLGAAVLARNPEGQGILDAVGARAIAFRLARTQQYTAFGYPAQPTIFEPTFDGERLYACDSPVTDDDNPPGGGPETLQIVCDMSGGSSGGGWVNADGALNGLTSYGYELDFDHLYGPYFGTEAQHLYDEATGEPVKCGGAEVTNLGRAAADDFSGGDGDDVFKLKGDADRARGFAGADLACGGGGNDKLKGGDDADTLRGGSGDDVLNGGPGNDLCIGGPGHDRGPGCEQRKQIP
jgi:V8-like Glu-specific endopeptidase